MAPLCPPPAPRHGPAGSPGTAPACPGVSSIAAPGIAPTLAGPLRSGFGCRIMVSEQPRAFLYTIPPFAPPNYVVLQSSGRGSHGGAPGARRRMGCQQDPSAGCCGLNASQGLAQGKKKRLGMNLGDFPARTSPCGSSTADPRCWCTHQSPPARCKPGRGWGSGVGGCCQQTPASQPGMWCPQERFLGCLLRSPQNQSGAHSSEPPRSIPPAAPGGFRGDKEKL